MRFLMLYLLEMCIGVLAISVAFALWVMLFFHPSELTLGNLVVLSDELATSTAQLQKSYDWTIAQWSGLGTVVLTATLGFISAATVESLKGTFGAATIRIQPLLILGIAVSLA